MQNDETIALTALAEGTVAYRDKARAALKRLRDYKRIRQTDFVYMPFWEEPGMQDDIKKTFSQYLRFHKGYYALRRHKDLKEAA